MEIVSKALSIVASQADMPPVDSAYLRNQRPEPITSSAGVSLPPYPPPFSKVAVLVEFRNGSQKKSNQVPVPEANEWSECFSKLVGGADGNVESARCAKEKNN